MIIKSIFRRRKFGITYTKQAGTSRCYVLQHTQPLVIGLLPSLLSTVSLVTERSLMSWGSYGMGGWQNVRV